MKLKYTAFKVALILFSVLFAISAFALNSKATETIISKFTYYNDYSKQMPFTLRIAMAKELNHLIIAMNAQLPNLSPSQESWVKEQLSGVKSSSLKKRVYFFSTPEYQIWDFRSNYLSPLISLTSQLMEHGNESGFANSHQEMFCWVGIASMLINRDFYSYISYFSNKKYLDKKLPGISVFLVEQYFGKRSIPQVILDHIISPYFKQGL